MQKEKFIIIPNKKELKLYSEYNLNTFMLPLKDYSIGFDVYFDIDKIKELWDEGYSIPEIVFLIGCSDNTVVRYLTNYKDFNSQNSRERTFTRQKYRIFDIKNYPSYQNLKLQRIPVFQYSLNGDYIASYSSIEEAARSLNKNNPENIGDIFRNKNRIASSLS